MNRPRAGRSVLLLAGTLLLVALSSCRSTASLPTPFPDELQEFVQVGEHTLPIYCQGNGEPTIILENGDGGYPWDSDDDLSRFSHLGRVCRYLRVGTYDPPSEVRTVKDQVHDLHALLSQVGVPGPYVLVGQAKGGLHLVLYAQEYPEEVIGLVCIECLAPTFRSELRERVEALNGEVPFWFKDSYDEWVYASDWEKTREMINVFASIDQALEVTSLGDCPMIVLTAGRELVEWTNQWEQAFADAWLSSQEALARLSEQSRLEIVPDVTHLSIVHSSAVDDAVAEIYLAAKQRLKPGLRSGGFVSASIVLHGMQ